MQQHEEETNKEKFGLLKRPAPIVLISIFHLLEPLIKVLYLKVTTGFSFSKVVETILYLDNINHIFNFWFLFLFPLAGLLLYSVKKIPYIIFMFLQVYIISLHLSYESFTWPYISEKPLLFSSLLILINIGLIIYLSLPKVRRPFLDKSIKWWQNSPRMKITLPCTIESTSDSTSTSANTLNISRTGIFMETMRNYDVNESVNIHFKFNYFNFTFRAKAVHSIAFKDKYGVGFRFKNVQFGDYYQKFKFMRAIRLLKV